MECMGAGMGACEGGHVKRATGDALASLLLVLMLNAVMTTVFVFQLTADG
jgi:hypothetical protein